MTDPLHQSTDLPAALRHRAQGPSTDATHALMWAAADEIERLRAVIRVNGLRAGATDAEIDEVIYAKR